MYIPFHKPYIGENEVSAVTEAIKSNWLTMGAKTFEFEKKFSEFTHAPHSIAVNSCTAALHLALAACNLKPNDEVIIPSLTFVADAEVVRYFDAIPVFADIEKETHNISVADVAKRITPRTKALIAVHFGGQPADMDELMDLCRQHGIVLIEDAAHAFPAFYKGRIIGSLGNLSAFSFYATKTLTTGEGGMLTVADDAIADRLRKMRLHGIDRDAWKRYQKDGNWEYDVTEVGYKYNITDIASAFGIEQLGIAGEALKMREAIAGRYAEAFNECDLLDPCVVKNDRTSAQHLYPVKLNIDALNIDRNQFITILKEEDIGTSVHYIPIYRFSYYRKLFAAIDRSINPQKEYPVSEYVFARSVSLPIYPSMTFAEVDRVIDVVLTTLRKNKR